MPHHKYVQIQNTKYFVSQMMKPYKMPHSSAILTQHF